MAIKDVKNYYYQMQAQYLEMKADLVDFEQALQDGFITEDQLEAAKEEVAKIEKEHEARYRKLLANVKEDKVFAKDEDVVWECGNCGHLHVGKTAPEICPVCVHKQAHFKLNAKNY